MTILLYASLLVVISLLVAQRLEVRRLRKVGERLSELRIELDRVYEVRRKR